MSTLYLTWAVSKPNQAKAWSSEVVPLLARSHFVRFAGSRDVRLVSAGTICPDFVAPVEKCFKKIFGGF
ncbi:MULTISPECIES: hypothetical protein [unclassified Mesorhizobium]|uniref:hypothetical protein n=1 Tax=unclassified Mesorhizobium TaxID=325217 RepID=UPI002415187E|nr:MULTISPECIES: hypothetical protein [unclassified Mesorhizobium]MDG4851885.1 hypothetical protein [Mesorhizobium sp. WSM4982]MDG4911403.1 hypothetical protein [Mesorhizobium sp. WSM4983]